MARIQVQIAAALLALLLISAGSPFASTQASCAGSSGFSGGAAQIELGGHAMLGASADDGHSDVHEVHNIESDACDCCDSSGCEIAHCSSVSAVAVDAIVPVASLATELRFPALKGQYRSGEDTSLYRPPISC